MRLILATNAPIPPIVVTDFGWSLLIAVAEIFGKCSSFNDYLQKCYNAIVNKSTSLPATFMRLDICHLSTMITRWPSLKGRDKCLVRFYKRCIRKASQISNLEELSYFIESILVVSLSKCIGSNVNNELLLSVERLRFLNDKIRGVQLKNDDDEINAETEGEKEFDTGENPEENEVVKVGWKLWSNQLNNLALDIVNQSTDGDMINACYNVDVAKKLRRYLLPFVPLWTSIMVPIFRRGSITATSAAVESEFSDLKNREFRGEIPMRIDRFVFQHLQRIDDKLKERCKVSDILPMRNDADEESEKQNITDFEFSKTGNSEATELQDIEIDDPQHATTKNVVNIDEISFNITAKNVCSTPNENRSKDRSDSFVSKETSAKLVSPITEEKIRGSR